MISAEGVRQYLAFGHEQRGVEFKASGSPKDDHFFAKVTRAVLGMANRRDGGFVLIGVSDADPANPPRGVSAAELKLWLDYDVIAERFAKYADPTVVFECYPVELDGDQIVVLEVAEFHDLPVLCKLDHSTNDKPILRKGACYVRSAHKPETSEIPSHVEMRELLDLAAEKRLRAFLSMTQAAGGVVVAQDAQATAATLYAAQLGELA